MRRRVSVTDSEMCLVVNDGGTLLGRLGREALRHGQVATVEEAMTEGPGTVRPNAPLAPLVVRLRERELTNVIVTRSDGTLVGVVRLEEAENLLRRADSAR